MSVPPSPALHAALSAGSDLPLSGLSILVVDDEVLIASLLAQECLDLGATVVLEAHGGAEALDLLGRHRDVAAVVCDVRMPGMDGPELARRALEMRPGLKVIFVTGYSGGLDTGGWPVLDKPVDPQRLARELSRLLRG